MADSYHTHYDAIVVESDGFGGVTHLAVRRYNTYEQAVLWAKHRLDVGKDVRLHHCESFPCPFAHVPIVSY